MTELLKKLCLIDASSGDEGNLRNLIIEKINKHCEYKVDNLGNIIAFKKGKSRPVKKVMLDSHLDEVGLIVTFITDEGFLKFDTVGGIDTAVLLSKRVKINGKTEGVIGMKPIHLQSAEDGKKLPKISDLYIDIGAKNKTDALNYVSLGDRAVVLSGFHTAGDLILSKALDDRVGCAVLTELLTSDAEYDFYAVFSVQEEVGLRGAKTASFSVSPDAAIILEGTTAADIAGVSEEKRVCSLGSGVAVSFMDKSTVYDREYYNSALNSGLNCQAKASVTGGNNSGAVHLSKSGVRTLALSVPCRYIHSHSSVCSKSDIEALKAMAEYMLNQIAGGKA